MKNRTIKKEKIINPAGTLAAVSAAFTAGLIPILTKSLLLDGLQTVTILFFRYLIVALILGLIIFMGKDSLKINISQLISLAIYSIIGYGGATFLLAQAFSYMPVGQATMLYFSYPVFVILIMTLVFKEKLDSRKCISLFLSVSGILCLIGFRFDLKTPGFFLAIGSGLAYGIYLTALQKSQLRFLSSKVIVFYLGCFSALCFGIQNLFCNVTQPSPKDIFLLSLLGGITVFVLIMVNYAIRTIGSADTSLIIALEAVVTLLFGVLIFHESYNFLTLIGAVLMLLSSITISLSARHPSTNG